MRIIRIGFSRSSLKFAIVSWLIQIWQFGKLGMFSHVYAQWGSPTLERTLVYQASHGMVHFINYSRWKAENIVYDFFDFEVSDETFKKINQFCIDKAGAPYAKLGLLGFLLEPIFGKNIFADKGAKYVCSELVAEILKEFLGVLSDKELDSIKPSDVHALLCIARSKGLCK